MEVRVEGERAGDDTPFIVGKLMGRMSPLAPGEEERTEVEVGGGCTSAVADGRTEGQRGRSTRAGAGDRRRAQRRHVQLRNGHLEPLEWRGTRTDGATARLIG